MPRASGPTAAPAADPTTLPELTSDATPDDILSALGFTSLDEAGEFTNALLFGQSGSGKTTAAAFAANLPGDGITVFINAESGLKKAALRRLGVDTSKIMIWPDREKGETFTFDSLERLLFRLAHALRVRPGSIKVVSFDSLTEGSVSLMEEITTRAFDKDNNLSDAQKQRRIAMDKKMRESRFETQLQDFGMMTSQGRTLVRGFRDLPCHFVATALERDDAVSDDGLVKQIGPELTPKLSTSVRSYVDVVFRLSAETLKTGPTTQETLITAETQTSLRLQTKDRLGVFPVQMMSPTFDRIHRYTQEDLTEDTDPEIARHREIRDRAEQFKATRRARPAAK